MDYFRIVRAPTINGVVGVRSPSRSSNADFNVKKVEKLATGLRGALFLREREFHGLRFEKAGVCGRALSRGSSRNPAA